MAHWSNKRFLAPLFVIVIYISAVTLTNAHFMADSGGYGVSILAHAGVPEYVDENPLVRDYRSENAFWDFGHLLWRPLGLVLFKVFSGVSQPITGITPAHDVAFLLMTVNLIAGLISVVLLYALIETLTNRRWISVLVVACFIFSHGFLNFTQTGSSYIAALAFLIAALYLLLKGNGELSMRAAIVAGLACAAAVLLWMPYVLVVVPTLAAPLVLFERGSTRTRGVLYAAAAFLVATGVVYLIVMAAIGVHTFGDLRDWISASSHGVRQSGVARVLFGVPRSFMHLGNDGVLFKRFLLHDPLNPVSAFDLVRLSLWKLVLFYLALASLGLGLFFAGRRMLALLSFTAAPLILFAIKFDGGAVERYLPLYAVTFLGLGWLLSRSQVPRALKIAPVLFFGFSILVNSSVMARMVLDRQNDRTSQRVSAVIPQLKPESWLVATHLQDDIVNFQASFPFAPVNREHTYHIYPLVVLNSDQAARWKEEFAAHVHKTWTRDGDVWLSNRLLSTRPEAEWNWVEGDDPRVPWKDIQQFFANFQTGAVAGDADGFVLLEKSEPNIQLLQTIDKGLK